MLSAASPPNARLSVLMAKSESAYDRLQRSSASTASSSAERRQGAGRRDRSPLAFFDSLWQLVQSSRNPALVEPVTVL
jgi:hypothetical protein